MLARLRDNLSYKVLALLCACALRWYVDAQQNPMKTRTVTADVVTRNLPDGMLIADQSTPSVTVTLEGSLDDLSRVSDTNVQAVADLSGAHTGRQTSVPVEVKLTGGAPGAVTISDTEPRTITLTLQPKRKRRMGIRVDPSGTPPEGYVFRKPDLGLCAEDNIQVVNATTACPVFPSAPASGEAVTFRKPLIVMTPEVPPAIQSSASSTIAGPRVQAGSCEVIDDGVAPDRGQAGGSLLGQGVLRPRSPRREKANKAREVAIVRLEQFYPWPAEALKASRRPLPIGDANGFGVRKSRRTWAAGRSSPPGFAT